MVLIPGVPSLTLPLNLSFIKDDPPFVIPRPVALFFATTEFKTALALSAAVLLPCASWYI